PILQALLFL
ncbi:arginine/agmatine antiporter, partial [Chlamydia psittaci 06-1683]